MEENARARERSERKSRGGQEGGVQEGGREEEEERERGGREIEREWT